MYIKMSLNDISNNIIECTICLDPIIFDNKSDEYMLECCKNYVHLSCLNNWCKNKNIKNCFICNQDNILINEMSNGIRNDLENNINDINDINYIQIQDEPPETIIIQENRCCTKSLIWCFILLFIIITCLGMLHIILFA